MLNLNSVMLSTEDHEALGAFYGELLQKEPDMQDKDSKMIGYLAGSSFISICFHDKVHGKNQNPERVILFFETSDVQGEFERVKAIKGVTVVKAPYHPDKDGKFSIATLADPDGNYFQLVSPWNG